MFCWFPPFFTKVCQCSGKEILSCIFVFETDVTDQFLFEYVFLFICLIANLLEQNMDIKEQYWLFPWA